MKLVYFGNNKLGLRVMEYLRRRGETITALVIHPPEKAKYAEEIRELSGVDDEAVFFGDRLRDASCVERMASFRPTLGLSVAFAYILKKPLLNLFESGVVNLHTSYLPYNRGAYPNVWSIVEGTPVGASLHMIDEGIDTGSVIARRRTAVELWDTGETLYRKLENAAYALFVEQWEDIKCQRFKAFIPRERGSFHLKKDVDRIDELELDKTYRLRDVLNILRARTFPPYEGAFVREGGRKVFIRVQLDPE